MSKRGLIFQKPLMNATGMLGFAPESRFPLSWGEFGAFVTNPLSLRPRRPAVEPALIEYPGGFLLHSGLPNPGFSQTLKQVAAKWARASLPVIVHLMADRPEETQRMTRQLENIENVMAVELGFAPLLADDIILLSVEMSVGELPLIVNLPWEQVLRLGPQVLAAGAEMVSLAAPRGALAANDGRLVSGRLFGPALFAQSLLLVREAARVGIPLIGGGGVYSKENASAMLAAGALAVQVDTVLWRGDFSPA
jgi:dihydroorotate dehydrogenase (NAD+) catalytic subunit